MNQRSDLERALRLHFDERADRSASPDQLERVVQAVAHRRQHPGWLARLRRAASDAGRISMSFDRPVTALHWLAILALLVLLAALVVALVGGGSPIRPLVNGRIVFGRLIGTGDPTIMSVEPDGTDLRPVLAPDGSPVVGYPTLAGDGRMAVTSSVPTGLACTVMALDGSRPTVIRGPSSPFNAACGIWARDRSWMAVESWDDSDPSRNGLYRVSAADGSATRLTSAPFGHDIPIAFSPDGRTIAFACATRPRPEGFSLVDAICTIPAGGGERRVVTNHTTGDVAVGSFTADGRSLILSQQGEGRLFRVDVATGEEQPVLIRGDPGAHLWEPRISPDGQRVLFGRNVGGCPNPDSQCMNLFSMRLDGTDVVRITNELWSDWFPDWGPG